MIDIDNAKIQFSRYLDGYDRSNDKIHLKIVHTDCVLAAADMICREEGFSDGDRKLAQLIALLHDIGRFEQIKAFRSFNDRLFDHASFGVKVLFGDRVIEQFQADRQFDGIIKKAIQYHSAFSLANVEGLSERELLHCRIIRDADKLDNFRVKETERLETLFDTSRKEVEKESISPAVMEAFRARRCVFSPDRATHMDFWASYLAFIFDLNFKSSFSWLLKKNYVSRNIALIEYQNPQTRKDMEEIREICNHYISERAAV